MKAINIPEFVNTAYGDWHSIKDDFTYTEKYANAVAEHNFNTKDLTTIIEDAELQIALNPKDYHGYYLKAVMLSENGDYTRASESARECIGIIEGLPDKGFKEYGDLGLAYFIANNIPKAIEMSRKAVEIKPGYLFAWMTLGDIYYQQRDYENTNRVYSKIIDLNNSVEYSLKRAQLKMGAQYYRQAINDLETILKSEDCHIIALQLLINCYSSLNDFGKVENLCTKLIGCNPNVGYFSRGNYYLHTGENQKAVDDFTEGLKYKRDEPRALFLRGQAYLGLKSYKKALSDLKKVRQLLLSIPENQRQIDIGKLETMIVQCEKLSK
jgi:tetratricopeptide (TPR) repeat protein